jgi:photosystem II stability/assembly factor-like uncharacterized protein
MIDDESKRLTGEDRDKEQPDYGRRAEDLHENRERDEEEGREFDMVRLHEQHFDRKRWEKSIEYKRQMPHIVVDVQDPGPAILERVEGDEVGIFIGKQDPTVYVQLAENPDEEGSFGFVGTFASVESKSSFTDGLLVLRFNPRKLGWVARESLRLFRWDEKAKRFVKVPRSDVSRAGDYVFGRITQAGNYTIIGVNTHPLALYTIKVICDLHGVLRAVPAELGRSIQDRICQLILCAPDMWEAIKDPIVWDGLQREGARAGYSLPGGEIGLAPYGEVAQNLCERCLGGSTGVTPGEVIPECDLIGESPSGSTCTSLGWTSVGPFDLSGCITEVLVDPGNSNRIYAAAYNGGVWTLDNVNGYPSTTWRPLTDQLEGLQMRAIAVAASDNQVIYAANSLEYLYRSSDRGLNWARTGNTSLGYVRKILVHPGDPQTILVASHTGLRISLDGGGTWNLSHTGDILDVAMDPLDSSVIYIAERASGVLKTTTLGFGPWQIVLDWSRANSPTSSMIKIALGYRKADGSLQFDSNRTVAVKFGSEVFVNQRGGRDNGTDWVSKGARGGNGYGDWCHVIAVDPFNPNVILAGQQELYRTGDGGNNWAQVAAYYAPHEDQQSVAFDRNNSGVAYLANDGGVFRSTNGGVTWYIGGMSVADEIAAKRSLVLGLVTAEFYRVGVQSNQAVGNLYHSGIIATSNLGSGRWEGIEGHAWEFNNLAADSKRPRRYYVFGGELLRRRYPGTGTDDLITFGRFAPYASVGAIAIDMRLHSDTILICANKDDVAGVGYRLMITKDGNQEPSRDASGNVVGLPLWDAVIDNGNDPIVSVTLATSVPGRAYAISDSGKVFSKNDVNAAGAWLEPGRWTTWGVRQLAVNSRHEDRLYAVTSNKVARSTDGGASWNEVGVGSLPDSEFNSIVTHPSDAQTLYLGADSGVYLSLDEGNTWSPYDTDLPNAEVLQIYWESDYLYAVTHGRGLWRRRPC